MSNNTESNFTQEIEIPSRGYFNPEIPEGKVTQRCMMVADQKFLAGSNRDANDALNSLIQRTITSPESVDISKFTIPDTLYLLFKLRILSYGKKYKFRTKCPECGRKIEVEVDLSELPVEFLSEDYTDKMVIELPNTKDKVYNRIITNGDNAELNKEIKRRKKRSPDDESEYILRISYSIEKIKLAADNKELTHPLDIERYISALTDYDASAIIASRDSISYGIIPVVDYVCPECKEDIEVNVQFSSEFFRPHFNF